MLPETRCDAKCSVYAAILRNKLYYYFSLGLYSVSLCICQVYCVLRASVEGPDISTITACRQLFTHIPKLHGLERVKRDSRKRY